MWDLPSSPAGVGAVMLRGARETLPGLADLPRLRREMSCQRVERRQGRRPDQSRAEFSTSSQVRCSFRISHFPLEGPGGKSVDSFEATVLSLEYEKPFDLFVVGWIFFFF